MYKGIVAHLAFVYGFIARGREAMTDQERRTMADGAHIVVRKARAVMGGEEESAQDRADLELARQMDGQIEENVVFLEHLEIV